MVSPVVICFGVIRSGSTWAYNVSRVLTLAGANFRKQKFGAACLGAEGLDQFLATEMPLGDGAAVIKVHALGPLGIERIAAGKVKAICTIRDPRDCVASDMVFWASGFEEAVARVTWSMQSVRALYRQAERALFIRYEEMMADRTAQIRRIGEYLNVGMDSEALAWVDGQTNMEASQKVAAQLASRPEAEVDVGRGNHRRDKITLLHDNHIGSAKVGKWKTELTAEQGDHLTKIFRESLEALGYEDGKGSAGMMGGQILGSDGGCAHCPGN